MFRDLHDQQGDVSLDDRDQEVLQPRLPLQTGGLELMHLGQDLRSVDLKPSLLSSHSSPIFVSYLHRGKQVRLERFRRCIVHVGRTNYRGRLNQD